MKETIKTVEQMKQIIKDRAFLAYEKYKNIKGGLCKEALVISNLLTYIDDPLNEKYSSIIAYDNQELPPTNSQQTLINMIIFELEDIDKLYEYNYYDITGLAITKELENVKLFLTNYRSIIEVLSQISQEMGYKKDLVFYKKRSKI